jgi:hypothetical protein
MIILACNVRRVLGTPYEKPSPTAETGKCTRGLGEVRLIEQEVRHHARAIFSKGD